MGLEDVCQFILPSYFFHAQIKWHFTKYEVWNIYDQNEGVWDAIPRYELLRKIKEYGIERMILTSTKFARKNIFFIDRFFVNKERNNLTIYEKILQPSMQDLKGQSRKNQVKLHFFSEKSLIIAVNYANLVSK